jgi:hypothetical protein
MQVPFDVDPTAYATVFCATNGVLPADCEMLRHRLEQMTREYASDVGLEASTLGARKRTLLRTLTVDVRKPGSTLQRIEIPIHQVRDTLTTLSHTHRDSSPRATWRRSRGTRWTCACATIWPRKTATRCVLLT